MLLQEGVGKLGQGVYKSSILQFEHTNQALLKSPEELNTRTSDLGMKSLTKLDTYNLHPLSQLSDKVPSESLLEDVNAALLSIPNDTFTETNKRKHHSNSGP